MKQVARFWEILGSKSMKPASCRETSCSYLSAGDNRLDKTHVEMYLDLNQTSPYISQYLWLKLGKYSGVMLYSSDLRIWSYNLQNKIKRIHNLLICILNNKK